MGLKTTNYEVKKLGITLPEAYAIIGKVELSPSGGGYAEMRIQSTRENAQALQPIETKRVDFFWDRKSDIAETIYASAKVEKTSRRINRETRQMEEVVIDKMFSGWEDDIILGDIFTGDNYNTYNRNQ